MFTCTLPTFSQQIKYDNVHNTAPHVSLATMKYHRRKYELMLTSVVLKNVNNI